METKNSLSSASVMAFLLYCDFESFGDSGATAGEVEEVSLLEAEEALGISLIQPQRLDFFEEGFIRPPQLTQFFAGASFFHKRLLAYSAINSASAMPSESLRQRVVGSKDTSGKSRMHTSMELFLPPVMENSFFHF